MKSPSILVALAAGGAIAGAVALYQPAIRAIDGDTVDHGFFRWRLEGLDAPETGGRARCPQERARGEAAQRRLAEMLVGGRAVLRPLSGFDRYGRRLARLDVGGRDAAAVLIGEGLAREYHGGRRQGWCG
jgi:micrococcal nuclease